MTSYTASAARRMPLKTPILPPGIAKQQLPDGLVHALPAPPRGYERIIVDGKVLLVDVATQIIHDILTDIVLR